MTSRKYSPFNEENGFDKFTETSSLKKSLDELVGKLDPSGEKLVYQTEIKKVWKEVTGENTSSHTEAVYVKNETIFVWMDSSIWANEINLMKDHYLQKINEKLENFVAKEIKVTANRFKKSLRGL